MSQFNDFEIQIDLTNVQEFGGSGGGPSLPAGEYVFDVVEAKQDTSKAGNSMIVTTFAVVESLSGDPTVVGKQITGWYTLKDGKGLGRIKNLMMACGARLDAIRASELIGGRIYATVIHEEGQVQVDQEGNPQPASVFAKVCNERALEAAEPAPAPTPPPVTRGKAANGATARRA
jgi:hypothetical protein